MHQIGPPHPTVHGLSRCICDQAIDLIGIHLLVVFIGESTWPHMMHFEIFLLPKLRITCFVQANTCFSCAISLNTRTMNGYCAYNRWYSHFGRCYHYWPNSCGFCFMSRFFLKNGYDDCSSSKSCVISQPTPRRWFHPSSNRDIGCLH